MALKNYETVFILTPVLSEAQTKDAVDKFVKVLEKNNADLINVETWGIKKLAYPIQHKSTGTYHFVEFKATPDTIAALETEFRRDETVMRFLTTVLDKHSQAFSEKRRAGMFNKKKEETK